MEERIHTQHDKGRGENRKIKRAKIMLTINAFRKKRIRAFTSYHFLKLRPLVVNSLTNKA
jgi:hypothetical protein